jgi:Ankyrin repeat
MSLQWRGRSNELIGNCSARGVPADCFDKVEGCTGKSFRSIGADGDSSLLVGTTTESSMYLDYSANKLDKKSPESLSHMHSPEVAESPVKTSVPPSMSSDATGSLTFSEGSEQALQRPPNPLLLLAQQHKWKDIYDVLRSNNSKYDLKTWFSECTNIHSGQTALHLVIKHKPPSTIVTLMIRRMRKFDKTDPQSLSDKFGTTPLHIAIAVACSVRVIEELLCGRYAPKTNPAAIADSSGRYPLHMACSKQVIALHTRTIGAQIICLLATAYPDAIFLKDRDGWTPKFMVEEYACHKAMAKALAPAEMVLMKQNGFNLNVLMDGVISPPLPLTDTGVLVSPDDRGSVSTLGWDEDNCEDVHEAPMYPTYGKYGTTGRESTSISHSATDTDITMRTDQNVMPRIRMRMRSNSQRSQPHWFI